MLWSKKPKDSGDCVSYSSNLHDRTQQRSLLQFTLYLYIEEQKSVLANQKEKSISKLLSWYETFSFYFCFSRISFWQTSINLQESVRLCILNARTKWMSFKCLDSPLCGNSMQASSIAIKVLRRNGLGLLKAAMSSGWWRFEVVFQVAGFLFGLQIFLISLGFIVGIITECPWVGCACFVCVRGRESTRRKFTCVQIFLKPNVFLLNPIEWIKLAFPVWGSNSPIHQLKRLSYTEGDW